MLYLCRPTWGWFPKQKGSFVTNHFTYNQNHVFMFTNSTFNNPNWLQQKVHESSIDIRPVIVRFSLTSRSVLVRLSFVSRWLFVSLSKTERRPNEEQAKNERKSNERRSRSRRETIEVTTRNCQTWCEWQTSVDLSQGEKSCHVMELTNETRTVSGDAWKVRMTALCLYASV